MTPEDPADRRRFARINTGGDYAVKLWAQGHPLEHAALKNISGCGCGVQILYEELPTVEVGTLLDRIYLVHPDLPLLPLQGSVVWVLGKHPGKTSGPILLGIDFTVITPFVQNLIDEHARSRA